VVGQVKLPVAPHSNRFFLVCDRVGEYHWVPHSNVSFESYVSKEINSLEPYRKASWFGFLDNAPERENIIQLTGELTPDGTNYVVFQMSARIVFNNDESFYVSINRTEDDRFLWRNADKTGLADSFVSAWGHMPAYVTNPDGYEESPHFTNDLPLWASFSDVEGIVDQSEF
jgi:hypothetical protein